MDDLQEFLAHQKALADMPEGDIDDYEASMRLRAKRRKLWKPADERPEGLPQKEREESEFAAYLKSLESTGDGSHEQAVETSNRPDQGRTRLGYFENKSDEGDPNVEAENPYSGLRSTSVQGNSSRRKGRGKSVSSSKVRAPSPSDAVRGSHTGNIGTASRHEEKDGDDRFSLDKECSDLPDAPEKRQTRVSKNGMEISREKVLKKRKTTNSDERTLPDTSNITSPSNSPVTSSSPVQLTRSLRPRPSVETIRKEKRARKAEKDKEAADRKKQEELEKKMTPREYASHVQSKFADYLAKTPPNKKPLRDKAVFYIGGDYYTASQRTRKKMDHLRKKGATVAPSYDPEIVTHIVTEGNAAVTLKALGLKSLDEIPMYIPTLTWSWVIEAGPDSPEFWYAAFPSRIDASSDKTPEYLKSRRSGKPASIPRPMEPEDKDYSHIEDFTVAHLSDADDPESASRVERSRPGGGTTRRVSGNDPLAEFYDQARKEAENDFRSSDDERETSLPEVSRSRWTCDQKPVSSGQCVNQDIVDKLSELEEINKTKVSGDPREQKWRVFSYGKSIRAIRAHPKRIRNFEDAISIRGIGRKTADKIVEIIKTGDLERIKHDRTEDVQSIRLFNDIYGVGLGTAQKWYAMGCRTLEDVKNRKGGITVSDVQELGLKYYDDINTRISRSEVEEIFNMVKSIALGIDSKLFFLLMGSYRRGAETCGDIDILMTRPTDDGKTHRGVLRRLLKELHLQGILTEDLAIPEDFDDLKQTYRGLCRRDEKGPRRRIDILVVPYHERGGALIYYTGDDIFNRAIRLKAKSMGYSLSQHGLAKAVFRDERGKKVIPADLVASETEEEIFRILGVPWQEPHERVRAL